MTNKTAWLTYNEAAEKLDITLDTVMHKAMKFYGLSTNVEKLSIAVPIEAVHVAKQRTVHVIGFYVHELHKRIANS